ncbi:MAG: nucleotidyltransferase family protein [Pseudomonadota bacterium]
MRALVLAGGLGTRLRPLTEHTPKCLIPIHNRPLLAYWFELLFDAGIERALVNTHWLAPQVDAFVDTSPHQQRIDLVYEPELLGTGGTLRANHQYFGDQPVLVAHADNLINFTCSAFLEAHTNRHDGIAITMLTFETDDPRSCGIVECDAQDRVIAFHEKVEQPPGNLANGAVYILEPEVLRFIAAFDRDFVDLSTEVIPEFLGRIQIWRTDGYHRDIGNVESLARAEAEFPKSPPVL